MCHDPKYFSRTFFHSLNLYSRFFIEEQLSPVSIVIECNYLKALYRSLCFLSDNLIWNYMYYVWVYYVPPDYCYPNFRRQSAIGHMTFTVVNNCPHSSWILGVWLDSDFTLVVSRIVLSPKESVDQLLHSTRKKTKQKTINFIPMS